MIYSRYYPLPIQEGGTARRVEEGGSLHLPPSTSRRRPSRNQPRPKRERGVTKPLPLGVPGLNQALCGAAGRLIAGEALGRRARPSTWLGAWLGDGQPSFPP